MRGSDFYAGYTIHQGLHQRGFVHFLRDVHDLKDAFCQDEELLCWAKDVKALSEEALTWVAEHLDPNLSPRHQQQVRLAQQHALEQRLPRDTQRDEGRV